MAEQQMQVFEGWAVVELFGHGRELGYVKTLYFGSQAMFQIDTPAIPERQVMTEGTHSFDLQKWIPGGSKILKAAIPSKTRIVGTSAVFAINPSTQDAIEGEIGGNGPIKSVIEMGTEKEPEDIPF